MFKRNAPGMIVIATVFLATSPGGGRAEAGVVIDISRSGSDVVAIGSGSFDLTSLSFIGNIPGVNGSVNPSFGSVLVGPVTPGAVDAYSGISGPPGLGTGMYLDASSGSGVLFGIGGSGSLVGVPTGYVSGSPLSGSATWDDATTTSLGLTSGTYTWAWGTGIHADSLTINVTSVPEPSSLVLGGIAVAAGLVARNRRSSRVARS